MDVELKVGVVNVHINSKQRRDEWYNLVISKAQLDVCAVTETRLKDEDEAAMRIELNGTDMNGSVDSRRKSKGKREGEGFLGEENLEAKVVKVGKEGNLLWVSVGKKEPWHLP